VFVVFVVVFSPMHYVVFIGKKGSHKSK